MSSIKHWIFILVVSLFGFSAALQASQVPFAKKEIQKPVEFFVFIPSYNNEKWVERNLEALFSQNYTNWVAYYVDDCSSDKTALLVENYVKARGFQDKVTIVHNPVRKFAMANYVHAIAHCPSHKVVVSYDGDDFFAHDKVLEKLARIYANPKVWMTYGTYVSEPELAPCVCKKLPKKVMKHRQFRKYKWVTSQLRTFYAALFSKIRLSDLKYKGKSAAFKSYKGQYVPSSCDLAMMFPMLEMASKGHIYYVKEVIYIYNRHNANDCVANRPLQGEMDHYVRKLKRYKPLKRLFPSQVSNNSGAM
jgi:glycosyltransferase involved in cell wall biosynthesis